MPKLLQKPRNKQVIRQDQEGRSDKFLVTGKNGFIGSHLIGGGFRGRITNYRELWKQTDGIQGIVHLAAKSNKVECEADLKACLSTNLYGVYNVLDVALKRKIWVLFISTFQVKDQSIYGLSKLMGEELCRVYAAKGLAVKILRLPIVYGPGDRQHKVVTKFINQVKAGRNPKIDTNKKFYFAYVDDVVKRIENEVNILNGGWGKKYPLTDLVAGIKECWNEDAKRLRDNSSC